MVDEEGGLVAAGTGRPSGLLHSLQQREKNLGGRKGGREGGREGEREGGKKGEGGRKERRLRGGQICCTVAGPP